MGFQYTYNIYLHGESICRTHAVLGLNSSWSLISCCPTIILWHCIVDYLSLLFKDAWFSHFNSVYNFLSMALCRCVCVSCLQLTNAINAVNACIIISIIGICMIVVQHYHYSEFIIHASTLKLCAYWSFSAKLFTDSILARVRRCRSELRLDGVKQTPGWQKEPVTYIYGVALLRFNKIMAERQALRFST